ncbi:TatD DNase family protein [Fontibacillus phaseoli]|uniref:TatD DNase family protein n=1 Tax=Fontibacillus phaseoli TaxID=1416533 RepID=A0A369B9W0_9BACL|nr:TatD family hydrolase [Fontibacillus phaseoli]RCX18105.1 TatD DNase family protein [Fontibacillus phaseoli]
MNHHTNSDSDSVFPLIDAHIHLDHYEEEDRRQLLQDAAGYGLKALIGVSMNLASSQINLALASQYPGLVIPAFGYHPEQPVPSQEETLALLDWMKLQASRMAAVGEIGLPYYTRLEAENQGRPFDLEPYIALLDQLLELAKHLAKPVVLHAVYEDADLVCDLLERHGIRQAHFHWFKGSEHTVRRMAERGYYVSFTPDLLYEPEIMELARNYPADLVMAETDGPWPFEGPFAGQATHPAMVRDVAAAWSRLHGVSHEEGCHILFNNARRFYGL